MGGDQLVFVVLVISSSAALLVSSRLHNFNRSVKEIARVVKLSEGTLRKRLGDFKDTASSRLTIDEFLKIDLEQEHDPPSYLEAKRKAKQKISDENLSLEEECEGMEEENEEEEEAGGTIGGFGGIRSESVDEIIAKARFTESFLAASSSIGLTNDLDELARLGETMEDSEDQRLESGSPEDLILDDIDDKEIDAMLLSEEEVRIKTQLWFAENGDFLKERELRRERMALEKAEKEKQRKGRTSRTRKPKTHHQQHMYSNAGEAIGKMLVEKRISTKINYDVLRDIEIDSCQVDSSTTSKTPEFEPDDLNTVHTSNPATIQVNESLTITRTPVGNRLPSLTNRKRSFSSLSSHPLTISHNATRPLGKRKESVDNLPKRVKMDQSPRVDTMESVLNDKLKDLEKVVKSAVLPMSEEDGGGSHEPSTVVEESGPVQYSEDEEDLDEEGLDDEAMEELIYEDDPLLAHSDYEDDYVDEDY